MKSSKLESKFGTILFKKFLLTVLCVSVFFEYGYNQDCTNPVSGGTISGKQIICSGTSPSTFINSSLPDGYSGTLQYKWQSSSTSNSSGFSDISTSDSPTFTAGVLNTTTWFKRLAKVTCYSDEWVPASVPLSNTYIFSEGLGGAKGAITGGPYDGGGGAGGLIVFDGSIIDPLTPSGSGGGANGGSGGAGGSGFGAGGGGGGYWYGVRNQVGGNGANGFAYVFNEYEEYFSQTNTNYTVQNSGNLNVIIMGGGGGGGGEAFTNLNGGGGAGYLQKYTIYVPANTVISITVGAGGTSHSNGGTTSVVIAGNTYQASGGYHGGTSEYGGSGSSAGGVGTIAPSDGYSGGNANPSATSQGTAFFNEILNFNKWGDALAVLVNQPSFVAPVFHVSDLQASGTDIKWYAASSGGSALAGNSVITNGTTYYASQTVNGVESTSRMAVTANVDSTPCAPTGASVQSFADGTTIGNLAATGSNIRWYSASSGGLALSSNTLLVNGTHYYASQTIDCTESILRLDVIVTILPN